MKASLSQRASREAMEIRYIFWAFIFILLPVGMLFCSFYPAFDKNLLMTAIAFFIGGGVVFYIVFVRQKFEAGNFNTVLNTAIILFTALSITPLGVLSFLAAIKTQDKNIFLISFAFLTGGIILFFIFFRNRKKIKIF